MARSRKQEKSENLIQSQDDDTIHTLGYTLHDYVDSDDDRDVLHLRHQISQLREVSVRIGDEIREQTSITDEMIGLGKSFKQVTKIYKSHSLFWNILVAVFILLVLLYVKLYRL